MDYGLWEVLERKVWSHGVRATTLEGLKSRIVQCWEEISQDTINNTIKSFRPLLKKEYNLSQWWAYRTVFVNIVSVYRNDVLVMTSFFLFTLIFDDSTSN